MGYQFQVLHWDLADAIQSIYVADGTDGVAKADVEPLNEDLDFEGFLGM